MVSLEDMVADVQNYRKMLGKILSEVPQLDRNTLTYEGEFSLSFSLAHTPFNVLFRVDHRRQSIVMETYREVLAVKAKSAFKRLSKMDYIRNYNLPHSELVLINSIGYSKNDFTVYVPKLFRIIDNQ